MHKFEKELVGILGEKNYNVIKTYSNFYKKVWLEVLKIPKGEVRTYKWIAQKIGHPKAYRAVGRALKENPLTVIIPCHRVVMSCGKIGGYSKGVDKKKDLLKKEKAIKYVKL